jgi:hypothetical protein
MTDSDGGLLRPQVAFRLNVAGYPANSDREMFVAFCANVTFDLSVEVLVQVRRPVHIVLQRAVMVSSLSSRVPLPSLPCREQACVRWQHHAERKLVQFLPCSTSATRTRACPARRCGSMRQTRRRDASAQSTKQVPPAGLLAILQAVLHPAQFRASDYLHLHTAACRVKSAAAQLMRLGSMSGFGHNNEARLMNSEAATVPDSLQSLAHLQTSN